MTNLTIGHTYVVDVHVSGGNGNLLIGELVLLLEGPPPTRAQLKLPSGKRQFYPEMLLKPVIETAREAKLHGFLRLPSGRIIEIEDDAQLAYFQQAERFAAQLQRRLKKIAETAKRAKDLEAIRRREVANTIRKEAAGYHWTRSDLADMANLGIEWTDVKPLAKLGLLYKDIQFLVERGITWEADDSLTATGHFFVINNGKPKLLRAKSWRAELSGLLDDESEG